MAATATHSGTFIQNPQRSKARRPSGATALRSPTPIGRNPVPFYIGGRLVPTVPNPRGAVGAPAPPAAPAPPPDPRDSDYWAGLADIRGTREGIYGDLDRQEGYAVTDRDDTLRKLVKARADSLLNAKRAANARGLFYSSFLTNQNADIGSDFNHRETDTREAYRRNHENLESARAQAARAYGQRGSEEDFGSEGGRLLREAIARALGQQVDAPAAAASIAVPQAQAAGVDTSATSAGDTSRDGGWGSGGLTLQDIIAMANKRKKPSHKVML